MSDFIRDGLLRCEDRPQKFTAYAGDPDNGTINDAIRRSGSRQKAESSRRDPGDINDMIRAGFGTRVSTEAPQVRLHTGSSGAPVPASFDKALADRVRQEITEGGE